MKPTNQEIIAALQTLRLAIAFVPEGEDAITLIVLIMGNMIATKEQLDWLTYTACIAMENWSLVQLRGLFCIRYDPADGVYVDCTIPGWTPIDVARRNEAIPLEDPTRLLAEVPETEPTSEDRAEWAKLTLQIRNAAARVKLRERPQPAAPPTQSLKEAEEEVAQLVAKIKKPSEEELARAVRDLELKLHIVDGGDAVH